jgi:acyl-CoA thioester hydrolase
LFTQIINPRFNETDAFGHINNTVYAIWFDTCRQPILRFFTPSLEPKDMHLILAHTSTDFLREVFYGKDVIVKTALEKVGTSSMHFVHAVYQNDKLCTTGKAVMIHFNHTLKKSIPIPPHIKNDLEKHIKESNWTRIL